MISIYCNENLRNTLTKNEILEYAPAYNGESIGLDLYNAGPELTLSSKSFDFNKFIPTGLHVSIPKGYVGILTERGSVTKTKLKLRAGVIDPGYTGEIFVNLVNIGTLSEIIKPYQKLPVQLVVVKCSNDFTVLEKDEYLKLTSDSSRQEGQVGSSD